MSTPAKRAVLARAATDDAGAKASKEEDISKARMHDRANFIVKLSFEDCELCEGRCESFPVHSVDSVRIKV